MKVQVTLCSLRIIESMILRSDPNGSFRVFKDPVDGRLRKTVTVGQLSSMVQLQIGTGEEIKPAFSTDPPIGVVVLEEAGPGSGKRWVLRLHHRYSFPLFD